MKKLFLILVMLVAINANAQWQPDVRLTNDPAISSMSLNNSWCVAANGNVVHTVWYDNRNGNTEIYYKRSTDFGINWGTDTRLTNTPTLSYYPSIAISGSVVHVVWQEQLDGNREIYYKRSTDGGTNWGVDTRLTNDIAWSESPSIAVSGSVVHVVWKDDRNGNTEIYYKRSIDDGINWGVDTRLTNNTANSFPPSIVVSGSDVQVVFPDNRDGNYEIYYKRSTDSGINWGADIRLTNSTAFSMYPSIAVSGLNLHVVWQEPLGGNSEIYYKRSSDGGINWGADIRLTNNIVDCNHSSIAVSGSNVHVVWGSISANNGIYYKRSTDEGINWGVDTSLTNNTASSFFPFITVSGTNAHIVWINNRDGNDEIYYKRNPTGNPVGINNISSEIPSSYSLSQNYPNPFNPTTKIRFEVANGFPVGTSGNDKVMLKIYDIQGRELQTLVNESLKPGTYEVNFDGSKLTSGVYFYKLITDSYSETKKMCLIK